MKLKNSTYDKLKALALIMPLLTTFVIAVMKIWNIPYAVEVGLTLSAFNTLISGIVKIASVKYNKTKKKGK